MVSKSNEEDSSGVNENAVMANADTNTGSSVPELAYPLNESLSKYTKWNKTLFLVKGTGT